jgi:hypothetical protein
MAVYGVGEIVWAKIKGNTQKTSFASSIDRLLD